MALFQRLPSPFNDSTKTNAQSMPSNSASRSAQNLEFLLGLPASSAERAKAVIAFVQDTDLTFLTADQMARLYAAVCSSKSLPLIRAFYAKYGLFGTGLLRKTANEQDVSDKSMSLLVNSEMLNDMMDACLSSSVSGSSGSFDFAYAVVNDILLGCKTSSVVRNSLMITESVLNKLLSIAMLNDDEGDANGLLRNRY